MGSSRSSVANGASGIVFGRRVPEATLSLETTPFYEEIGVRRFAAVVSLLTVSISLWLFSAAAVRIAVIPPDAFFYLNQLSAAYWAGLFSTLALFLARSLIVGRARTWLELAALFMLSLYLIGLPSFVYQNPRFLDTYQHEGNSLSLLFLGGWLNNPVWYVYQFPGAYTFFAELTAVAGIDPFQLMLYYPVVLSIIVAFFAYAIARMFGNRYSPIVAAVVVSGFWFQLHLSPQSLELIPYLGLIYLLLRMFEDRTHWRLLTAISIGSIPVFVFSHPETSLVTSLGMVGFVILKPIVSSERLQTIKSNFSIVGPFLLALVAAAVFWWFGVATAALKTVLGIADAAAAAGFGGLPYARPKAPPTPLPSYQDALFLEEGMSAAIWVAGLFTMLFMKRFRKREYFLAGLFLAAIATIPVALFGNPDVLQRSYLFALIPFAFLSASLLERRAELRIRGWSFLRPYAAVLMLIVISFSVVMPVARYAGDSFAYLPESDLLASNVAAMNNMHSLLVAHPGWYAEKYYAPFYGYEGAILLEQSNITGRSGAYIKATTYGANAQENLTFTPADGKADYLQVQDFFDNLYIMRFGSNSIYYVNLKSVFEINASYGFNLVYSTGTDRLYENRNLG